jgi:hypothetical protein
MSEIPVESNSAEPTPIAINADGDDLLAEFPDARELLSIRSIRVRGEKIARRNELAESVCVVHSGVHDLYAGGGSWPRRGLRTAPFDGRPVAIYLPPSVPYGVETGDGILLVASVRQPELSTPLSERERLARKPLLPLMGSGKAFDPSTGEWRTRESFPESPEAILPRRVLEIDLGHGARLQRILPFDYKARGLCADELTLAAHGSCRLTPPTTGDYPREAAAWIECESPCEFGGHVLTAGTHAFRFDPQDPPILRTHAGRAWALLVYAGTKSA